MLREMRDYPAARGATAVEVNRIREGNIRGMPNRFETRGQIANGIQQTLRFGRPHDYYVTLTDVPGPLLDDSLNAAADRDLPPGHLAIVGGADREHGHAHPGQPVLPTQGQKPP